MTTRRTIVSGIFLLLVLCELSSAAQPAVAPKPTTGDHVIRNFTFTSGATLPELRLHYLTYGSPRQDAKGVVCNAVLVLHGTTGSSAQFIGTNFAGTLFGAKQLLDAERYFIIIPDNIGHGKSSKPSDGLRAKFPNYGYADMIEAQRRLLTEGLGVNHLRLVMGTSMGGMHTWLWGELHPDFMDALMPLACLPTEISGRNRVWRRMIIDSIRGAPDWQNGDYTTQPHGARVAHEVLYFMGNNPTQRLKDAPTLAKADESLDRYVNGALRRLDANDVLYALEASRDYNPAPALEKIRARLLALNFADDLINPPELRVLEREIKRVKNGKAIVISESEQTRGHGTHTIAAVWERHLKWLLKKTERPTD
jgi:homoserine O-acetyltransferase/O-succinyltransferase